MSLSVTGVLRGNLLHSVYQAVLKLLLKLLQVEQPASILMGGLLCRLLKSGIMAWWSVLMMNELLVVSFNDE